MTGAGAGTSARDGIGVDHDIGQALPPLAPAPEALRVELQGVEPHLRVHGVLALQAENDKFSSLDEGGKIKNPLNRYLRRSFRSASLEFFVS